ncbi:MAG: ADP-glyceromanno-heptose 6-epimerase [Candidatus Cloacimonadota bacterium]|nr:MAG: ADP-glyceromanno-heptose 6-epimerase [Candidatus Cloacimonadota bacterium]
MIVLTGGAGFIGSVFLKKLNDNGIKDVLVVDELGSSDKWKNLVGKEYIDFVHKDEFMTLLDNEDFDKLTEAIIHLGACSSTTERDADFLMDNNHHYTSTLAEWAAENNVYFLYASSAASYGNGDQGFDDDPDKLITLRPENMYGYSKHLSDLWSKRQEVFDVIASVKFFNVFGPNEYHKNAMRSMVHKAFEQIKETGKIKLFKSYKPEFKDGCQLRDFVYVKDVVDVMFWMLENRKTGLYNIGSGVTNSWIDLANAVFKAMGKEPEIEFIEMPEHMRDRYQYYTKANIKKLREAGYEKDFTSLEDAVDDYIKNYLENDYPFY